jgi:hypothetical protein
MEVQDVVATTHLLPGIQSRGCQNVDLKRHVSRRGWTTPRHWTYPQIVATGTKSNRPRPPFHISVTPTQFINQLLQTENPHAPRDHPRRGLWLRLFHVIEQRED